MEMILTSIRSYRDVSTEQELRMRLNTLSDILIQLLDTLNDYKQPGRDSASTPSPASNDEVLVATIDREVERSHQLIRLLDQLAPEIPDTKRARAFKKANDVIRVRRSRMKVKTLQQLQFSIVCIQTGLMTLSIRKSARVDIALRGHVELLTGLAKMENRLERIASNSIAMDDAILRELHQLKQELSDYLPPPDPYAPSSSGYNQRAKDPALEEKFEDNPRDKPLDSPDHPSDPASGDTPSDESPGLVPRASLEWSFHTAIRTNNAKALQILIQSNLDDLALGELSWMREVASIGVSAKEITELVLEQKNDAPWVFFRPRPRPRERHFIQQGHHGPSCPHRLFDEEAPSASQHLEPSWETRFSVEDQNVAQQLVHEACGLAGIRPCARDRRAWVGSVKFQEKNTKAIVSYGVVSDGDVYFRSIIDRLSTVLGTLCSAVGELQHLGLFCDSLTIAVTLPESPDDQAPGVRLCRIPFSWLSDLYSNITGAIAGMEQGEGSGFVTEAAHCAFQVLHLIDPNYLPTVGEDLDQNLHVCALVTQILCMALFSYSRAHIEPIQPFCIDTALEEVHLVGSRNLQKMPETIREGIKVNMASLTCLGGMLTARVITFESYDSRRRTRQNQKRNLITSAEDLLDTWGPGRVIVSKDDRNLVLSIHLGDGTIRCTDPEKNLYHWTQDGSASTGGSEKPVVMNGKTLMTIGLPVSVNGECTTENLGTDVLWDRNARFHVFLGPHEPRWVLKERSLAGQGGQYVVLQAGQAWERIPGRSVKQVGLSEGESFFLPYFDRPWGLQISICTGVARRVPLYNVIGDLVEIIAGTFTKKDEVESWVTLKRDHDVVTEISAGRIKPLLPLLSPEHHDTLSKVLSRTFGVLGHTGVSEDGKTLIAAWPRESHPYGGLEIPCPDSQTWARVIADCKHTAAFVYISTECLITDEVGCRGPPNPDWGGAICLVESSVFLCDSADAVPLQDGGIYFFNKFSGDLFVATQKPNGVAAAKLTKLPRISDQAIAHRLKVKFHLAIKRQIKEMQMSRDVCEDVTIH